MRTFKTLLAIGLAALTVVNATVEPVHGTDHGTPDGIKPFPNLPPKPAPLAQRSYPPRAAVEAVDAALEHAYPVVAPLARDVNIEQTKPVPAPLARDTEEIKPVPAPLARDIPPKPESSPPTHSPTHPHPHPSHSPSSSPPTLLNHNDDHTPTSTKPHHPHDTQTHTGHLDIPSTHTPSTSPPALSPLHPRDIYTMSCTGANLLAKVRTCTKGSTKTDLNGAWCLTNCQCNAAGCMSCDSKRAPGCTKEVLTASCRAVVRDWRCVCAREGDGREGGC